MANTTNYNWETPDDTDLVKDGAAAIRTLGSSVDTTTKALNPSTTLGDIEYRSSTANTNTRLGIGTTGQVLSVVGGVPAWATSDDANAIQNAIVDAKGDIITATAADTPARLAVGANGTTLVANSATATGLEWAAPAAASFVGVKVTKTTAQTCAASTEVFINWDAEEFDTNAFHDNSINNNRLTVPSGQGGYYKVYFQMQWQTSANAGRRISTVYKNGTSTVIGTFETSSVGFCSNVQSFTVNLAATDFIQIGAVQTTSASVDFRYENAFFGMEKIG